MMDRETVHPQGNAMKIDKSSPNEVALSGRARRSTARPAEQPVASAHAPAARVGDSVSLSSAHELLSIVRGQTTKLGDVHELDEIRAMIRENSYKPDLDALADRLVKTKSIDLDRLRHEGVTA